MDPISRLPEMYFIKNHSRGRGHRIGDSQPDCSKVGMKRGEQPGRPWEREETGEKGERQDEIECAGRGRGESRVLAEKQRASQSLLSEHCFPRALL